LFVATTNHYGEYHEVSLVSPFLVSSSLISSISRKRKTFGEMLALPFANGEKNVLPSPEELKCKILLKGMPNYSQDWFIQQVFVHLKAPSSQRLPREIATRRN